MMRSLYALLIVGFVLSLISDARGQSFSITSTYMGDPFELYGEVWVAPQTEHLRGVLLMSAYSEEVRLAASSMNLACIGMSYTWNNAFGINPTECGGHFQEFMNAAAVAAGRPELANAAVATYGFCQGASTPAGLAALVPERTICFFADKSAAAGVSLLPYEVRNAAAQVPGILTVGNVDNVISAQRANGSFMGWRVTNGGSVSQFVDWPAGHYGSDNDLIWTHIQQSINVRCPQGEWLSTTPGNPMVLQPTSQTGYLGQSNEYSTQSAKMVPLAWPEAAPLDEYTGDVTDASWLASLTMARVFQAHNSRDPLTGLSKVSIWNDDEDSSVDLGQTLTLSVLANVPSGTLRELTVYDNDTPLSLGPIVNGQTSICFSSQTPGVHTITAIARYNSGGVDRISGQYDVVFVQPTPEPSSLAMLACSAILLVQRRRNSSLDA